MAKLAAFLERLAEKAAARDTAAVDSGVGSSSLYAKQCYWDERYEEGAIGGAADKGELSNEWCVGGYRWQGRPCTAYFH